MTDSYGPIIRIAPKSMVSIHHDICAVRPNAFLTSRRLNGLTDREIASKKCGYLQQGVRKESCAYLGYAEKR